MTETKYVVFEREELLQWLGSVALPPWPVTHACPEAGSSVTPCCGKSPFELDQRERMSLQSSFVTCGKDGADGGSIDCAPIASVLAEWVDEHDHSAELWPLEPRGARR